ncbi:MAG: hypothetical protein NT076_04310 [Candidatus Pacearchaeota archaeon]|nr:hypothetical protein [Candidatus Pacearchaeota archaeon]
MKIAPSLICFVGISKRRKEILLHLKERQISQPELMRLTGMYKAHTSRTLRELKEKRLIECANPQDRAFKFYKVTNLGKRVLAEVKRITSE